MIALADPSDGTSLELVDLLVGLLEFRDPYFRGGSSLCRLLATATAEEMGLGPARTGHLALAALLRDLGRVAVGGRLTAPGPELDAVGRDEIRRHVDTSLRLLEGVALDPEVRDAVRHHHEQWDGGGYPDRLRGDRIPLAARILAVADSFSAMVAPRPYRLPKRIPEAVDELRREAGTRYDPDVVAALVRVLARRDQRSLAFGLRHHVLVVDGEEQGATAIAAKLCSNGYLAEVVPCPAAARERLKRSPVDALVLAADLADRGAEALLREVRHDLFMAELPVVVTSADDPELRVALLDAGADACLASATAFAELRATLASLVGRAVRTRASVQPAPSAGTGAAHWHALQGDLRDFPLGWLLQVMKYDSRTAVLVVWRGEEQGTICIERGDPCHAETRSSTGVDAVRQMLAWEQGSFLVHPNTRTADRTVDCSLMRLLLEEAVTEDHSNHIFGAVAARVRSD
jgi:response regulator RpfG family c-di-GMP phosphodiesterase